MQNQNKLVKNSNWWEAADQLAIYKPGPGIETRNYRVTNPVGVQGGNCTRHFGFEVPSPNHSATLSPLNDECFRTIEIPSAMRLIRFQIVVLAQRFPHSTICLDCLQFMKRVAFNPVNHREMTSILS